MRIRTTIAMIALLVGSAVFPGPPSQGADSGSRKLSTSELRAIIIQDKALASSQDVEVVGTGPQVTVMTAPAPGTAEKDLEKDLKIDAMFVARSLIEAVPGQIEAVKVLYNTHGRDARFVIINKLTVDRFGSGKISAEDLLASLSLETVGRDGQAESRVAPGPLMERRLLISRRIDELRNAGTDVRHCQELFDAVEAQVRGKQSSNLEKIVADLETRLSEQEKDLAQARRTAQGKGVPGIKKTEAPKETMLLLRAYSMRAPEIMRRLSRGQSPDLAACSSIGTEIDKLLKAGKPEEAAAKIKEFSRLASRSLGYEPFNVSGRHPPGKPPKAGKEGQPHPGPRGQKAFFPRNFRNNEQNGP
ncbi:MAG: hypothetical protein AB7W16_21675 [Candidatus Obscuribacterales bacterium]